MIVPNFHTKDKRHTPMVHTVSTRQQRHPAIKMHPRQVACLVILIAHATLTIIYSLTTPLWESFDEPGHYSYARYIAIHHALPPLGVWLSETNESHQPPLYYILAAIPMSFVDTSDDAQPKFTAGGNTFVVVNKQLDSFPYRGTALALRLGRMISVVLSTIAVAVTYAIMRTAFPSRPEMALFATAIHAFWPLYLFLGGMLSNDVGISLAGSITTLFVVRLWVKPLNASRRWDYLGLMVSVTCAVLTKDNGLALVLFAGLIIIGLTLRDLRMRRYRKLAELLYFIVPFFVLFLLGGLLTNGRVFRQVVKAFTIGSTLAQNVESLNTSQTLAQSVFVVLAPYFERFPGWLSVTLSSLFSSYSWGFLNVPAEWLQLATIAGIVATAGMILGLIQRKTRNIMLLMLLCIICASLAALIGGTSLYYHARAIVSSLSAIVVFITIGLFSLPRLVRRISAGYALVVVQMVALMSPVLVMAPVYRTPTLLDPVAIPAGIQVPSSLIFGDSIRLLGYSYPSAQVERGQDAAITLYWRALRNMSKDYAIKLELFSASGESFQVQSQATPGNNNFPTSSWKPGDTFAETYRLAIKLDAPAPTLATFRITWFSQQTNIISWYRPETQDVLSPTCDNGVKCEPKVGALPVRLDSATAKQWENKPAFYHLGQHIEIVDYQAQTFATAGQDLRVPLVWRTDADNLGDLTTFMHLFSSDGKLVAQVDSPPLHGTYPTSVWGTGEVIPDYYTLPLTSTLPSGIYHLKIGMYDARTHDRLSASDAAGAALADNVIPLQDITISK